MRGEGAVLRDGDGTPVMAGVHPLGDLAPRDVVTRAVAARMAATGARHLWLDATSIPAEHLERRFPTILARCRAAGIEPSRQPIPVSPAAHYLMGGVVTDLDGRTSLPGPVRRRRGRLHRGPRRQPPGLQLPAGGRGVRRPDRPRLRRKPAGSAGAGAGEPMTVGGWGLWTTADLPAGGYLRKGPHIPGWGDARPG
jgi:hypothetical protein